MGFGSAPSEKKEYRLAACLGSSAEPAGKCWAEHRETILVWQSESRQVCQFAIHILEGVSFPASLQGIPSMGLWKTATNRGLVRLCKNVHRIQGFSGLFTSFHILVHNFGFLTGSTDLERSQKISKLQQPFSSQIHLDFKPFPHGLLRHFKDPRDVPTQEPPGTPGTAPIWGSLG